MKSRLLDFHLIVIDVLRFLRNAGALESVLRASSKMPPRLNHLFY